MKKYKCEIDVAYNYDEIGEQFADMLMDIQGYGLQHRIIKANGATGGFPEVEVRGSYTAIKRYLKSYEDELEPNIHKIELIK